MPASVLASIDESGDTQQLDMLGDSGGSETEELDDLTQAKLTRLEAHEDAQPALVFEGARDRGQLMHMDGGHFVTS